MLIRTCQSQTDSCCQHADAQPCHGGRIKLDDACMQLAGVQMWPQMLQTAAADVKTLTITQNYCAGYGIKKLRRLCVHWKSHRTSSGTLSQRFDQ
jgi:hypothetical protein